MRQRFALIVEDDNLVLHSLRMQVKDALPPDFIVETANNGEEGLEVAMEIVESNGVLPILISDHQMPGMTGSELILKIAEIVPRCKNILLTGQANFEDVTALLNKQALYRYVSKPWDKSDLQMTILSGLGSFNQTNKLEKLTRQLIETNENLESLVEARTNKLRLKTKEVESGLDFARSIQQSLMSRKDEMERFFSSADILYRPFRKVSGDFYSFYESENENKSIVVIGDATGHGVAGAFLSVLANEILENSINHKHISNPYALVMEVLTRFRELSHSTDESLRKSISIELTIVLIDKEKRTLEYSTNSKQIRFIKDDEAMLPKETLFECCKGNANSDGLTLKHMGKTGKLTFNEFDKVVLYTDGIIDQFLQSTGKKLLRRVFLEAVIAGFDGKSLTDWFSNKQGTEPNVDDATGLILQV